MKQSSRVMAEVTKVADDPIIGIAPLVFLSRTVALMWGTVNRISAL